MLQYLEGKIKGNAKKIDEWFESHQAEVSGPIYASVDIRNAGYKIAPVDTNIFPGGFNNLCPSYLKNASELFQKHLARFYPDVRKVMIIPENHSRNKYYFSNVKKIMEMVEGAGYEVRIGSLRDDFDEDCIVVHTAEEEELEICKLRRSEDRLFVHGVDDSGDGFEPDLLLLNNDMSDGIPEVLSGLSQPLVPSPMVGWHVRQKSDHFSEYRKLIVEFSEVVDVDPWLLEADFVQVKEVDFSTKDGLERVAEQVDAIVARVTDKYKEYSVSEIPYAFVKNDAGTYGMAVTNARSGDQLLEMNRKMRNKMNVGKGSVQVGSVIVQEGVPTIDRFKGLVAEPVLYLVDNQTAGGFFRLNDQAGPRSNLNKKGMKFSKLCFHEMLGYSNEYQGECDLECLARIYKMLARIASMAAGYEIKNVTDE